MVFIKRIISGSKTYYYLVRSYRLEGEVHQEIIKKLTPEQANNPDFISQYLEENPQLKKTDMKAIILAAGKSIRLYPYSQDLPKSLIPIGEKPILRYTIDALKMNGIFDILLVAGFQGQKIRETFKNDVRYIFNPFYTISNILASLWAAYSEMKSPLMILYGDILFDSNIIAELIQDPNEISLVITASSIDNESEKVIVKDELVSEIGKEILVSSTEIFEFAGIIKFGQEGVRILHDTIEEMAQEEGFLEMQLPALIQRLIHKGHQISTQITSANKWIDIDFPKDIRRAEDEILPQLRN
ncbi:MAG: phosphocholine cytidylyltransferase family protein [Candidatus Kariarchaeaceae archaeon]|jgi:choline kinase